MPNTIKVHLFSTAASVLGAVAQEPSATIRELAQRCTRTERAIWRQLRRLEQAGLLGRRREGRRNRYFVDLPGLERQLADEGGPLFFALAGSQRRRNGRRKRQSVPARPLDFQTTAAANRAHTGADPDNRLPSPAS